MSLAIAEKTTKYAAPSSDESIVSVKAALESQGFKVKVVENLSEARNLVEKLIPKGSEVLTNTSVTLDKAGITKQINESSDYVSVRDMFMPLAGQPEKAVEMKRIGSAADYALGSVHAITQDGQVVIASASGSQIPGYAYGASNVIWVVGSQKIVGDLDEAFDRIENYAFHLEDKRAMKAYGVHSSVNKILVYRKELTNRVTIILVKQAVGF